MTGACKQISGSRTVVKSTGMIYRVCDVVDSFCNGSLSSFKEKWDER